MSWLSYALISAVAAALTAILAKIGVDGVPSTLATAIRTRPRAHIKNLFDVVTTTPRSLAS